jgi:hypothetical protein
MLKSTFVLTPPFHLSTGWLTLRIYDLGNVKWIILSQKALRVLSASVAFRNSHLRNSLKCVIHSQLTLKGAENVRWLVMIMAPFLRFYRRITEFHPKCTLIYQEFTTFGISFLKITLE